MTNDYDTEWLKANVSNHNAHLREIDLRRLWYSVITQIFNDAFPTQYDGVVKLHQKSSVAAFFDAHIFLSQNHQDIEYVADLAGMSADQIKSNYRSKLKEFNPRRILQGPQRRAPGREYTQRFYKIFKEGAR